MFKLVLEKAEEPEIKLPTSAGSWKKQEFQENIYFCFIDYVKAFDYVDHNKLWKLLKEMGIPHHLNCLLRRLYAGQEATVRTRHGTTDWFQIGKGVCQGCVLSSCEYIMQNAWLDEAQAGIKTASRNVNNLRYVDDTTLMAESEEELKRLLMKVKKESEKVGLKLNIQKTKIMASGPITSWQIDGETVETVADFIFLVPKITADGDCSNEIKKRLLLMNNPDSIFKSRDITLPAVRSHRWQPTSPWDSPGKNTGVGCHFLLQGNLPNPGIKPRSLALQADSLAPEPPGTQSVPRLL